MRKVFEVALGILTAIGGFVDIGDLVVNAQVGARFGLSLGAVVLVGILGICVFAEMSGRVAACSGRPTFDLVRERLGPRMGALNLFASVAVTLLTFTAEIGGIALAVILVTSVSEFLVVPFAGLLVWAVLWRAKFSVMENVLGILGLCLVVFVVAVWQLGPDWSGLSSQFMTADKPRDEDWLTYAYFAVALFGAAMTPYEVFFFSSGGVEERWTEKDLGVMRANVLIGFPLGGLISLGIATCAATVLGPLHVDVEALSQVGLPIAVAFGKIGVAVVVIGFVAATFGAACETGLSAGYSIAQFFGWQWGKFVRPKQAARFHAVLVLATVVAVAILMTGVDPILVTELSVVFSAVALPLTYFPILVVANDRDYMGRHANSAVSNTIGTIYLVIVVVAAVAAIPLLFITHMGAGV
jgi:Mn2+/Fe2+ NRAMP family transporter